MKLFELKRCIDLKIDIEECWQFFSKPENLKFITPDYMGFDIINGGDRPMFEGQIIAYKVSPLFKINLTWITEITHVEEQSFFVDEQRFGPYKFWHHKHFFEKIPGGVRCRDEVHYMLHGAFLAPLLNRLTVSSKLNEIFDYRSKVLTEKFGEIKAEEGA